jgi:hypothetical protein
MKISAVYKKYFVLNTILIKDIKQLLNAHKQAFNQNPNSYNLAEDQAFIYNTLLEVKEHLISHNQMDSNVSS